MKIKCEKCGRLFDYEKNEGVCDNCGRYHSRINQDNPYNTYQTEKHDHILHDAAKYDSNLDNNKTRKERFISVILIVCMIVVAIYYVGSTTLKKQKVAEQKQIGLLEPTVMDMKEPISLHCGTLKLTGCSYFHKWDSVLPAGYRLLSLTYEMNWTEDAYCPYKPDVFLCLDQTYYLQPLNEYSLAEEVGLDYEQLQQEYLVGDCLDEEQGRLIYLVPDGFDQIRFLLYTYQYVDDQRMPDEVIAWEAFVSDDQ